MTMWVQMISCGPGSAWQIEGGLSGPESKMGMNSECGCLFGGLVAVWLGGGGITSHPGTT